MTLIGVKFCSIDVFKDVQIYVYLKFSTRNQIILKVFVKGSFHAAKSSRFDSFEFVMNFVKIHGLEGLWDEMPIDIVRFGDSKLSYEKWRNLQ